MQDATVDLLPHSSPASAAEGGRCKPSIRESITQALLRASEQDRNDSRRRFLPRSALVSIINTECAERVLQASLERCVEDKTRLQEMARDISPNPGACVCYFKSCTGRRMILATLLLFGREDLILSSFSLPSPQICDNDLPLSLDSLNDMDPNLSAREKELFVHMQWEVYTPFLTDFEPDKKQYFKTFPEQVSLPWIEKNRLGERLLGEWSYVEQIKICPGNHDLGSGNDFALKTFEQRLSSGLSRTMFKREVEANLEAPKHDRIVRLLTAFSYRERFYILFPFAKEGSLERLWKNYTPDANWYSDEWLVRECLGITEALMATHGFADGCPEWSNGLLHSDIKPENILCFPYPYLDKPCIVLKLADFGEAQRLKTDVALMASTVAHVKTYRPPEHSPGNVITLNYDVWCLGCLFLDFVTWAILGQDGIDAFTRVREHEQDDPDVTENPGQLIEDTFFKRFRKRHQSSIWKRFSLGLKHKISVESGWATTKYSLWVASRLKTDTRLKDGVISHMLALQAHDKCSDYLRRLLLLVQQKMLVVDPYTRAGSREVRDFLRELIQRRGHE